METTPNEMLNAEEQAIDGQEQSLRPKQLNQYIGQARVKENLKTFMQAALLRKEPLDHVLLYGPPGLGKTTLANIIANTMQTSLKSTSGPVIEKQGDLAALLTSIEPNQVLFIDEIHRLNPTIEEVLYSAMEDFTLDIMIGQGPSARSVKLDLPHFTLIGATTRAGALSSPLRDRFGIPLQLQYYQPQELKTIILQSAAVLKLDMLDEAALVLGKRSRGTPRIANRLLRRSADFAQVDYHGIITEEVVNQTLSRLGIDEGGLDQLDRAILKYIMDVHQGGPVGIQALAAGISQEVRTLEDMSEPFLLQEGFLTRTPRGRAVTQKAYDWFNKKNNSQSAQLSIK